MSASDSSGIRSHPSAIDRSAAERDEPGLLERLALDPATLVIATRRDAVPVTDAKTLRMLPISAVPHDAPRAFLGRTATGAAVFAAALADDDLPGIDFVPLRLAGGGFDDVDAQWAVTAVSITRWLHDGGFCPTCGGRALLAQAGWSRRCETCGRQHFPRTDPAVIVAVTDPDDERLLLGSNAAWQQQRYSCFAGFAEAGESLEAAVCREVEEEAGVRVVDPVYRGSQSWPYPRSLMLGFRAVALDPDMVRADGEEILDARWFTREELSEALAGRGEIMLPGPASIAHRLIVEWVEARP